MLSGRLDSLRTLADATDGLAIVNSNDLAGGLRRVVADLSSSYLIGYYSTGKLDGRFHSITVRVKRPGVKVRARRGYLASTPAAAAAAARAAASGAPQDLAEPDINTAAAEAGARAIEAAIGPLAGYAREVPLRLQVAAGWKPGDTASAAMWVVGELGGVATLGDAWNNGFDVTITLTTPADATVGSGSVSVGRGARTFRVAVTPSQPLAPGDYVLRVGARAGPASIPSRETARLAIPGGAGFSRRDLRSARSGEPGGADRRFALPPERAGAGRNPDGAIGRRHGAAARSHGEAARGAGDRGAARRRGRVAVADGAARARAPGARGLRDRDGGWGRWGTPGHRRVSCSPLMRQSSQKPRPAEEMSACRDFWLRRGRVECVRTRPAEPWDYSHGLWLRSADSERQRPRRERLAVGAENPFEQIDLQRAEALERLREAELHDAVRAAYWNVKSAAGVTGSPRSTLCASR